MTLFLGHAHRPGQTPEGCWLRFGQNGSITYSSHIPRVQQKIMPKFHIETQRPDGIWQTFTSDSFESREAAERHMEFILAKTEVGTARGDLRHPSSVDRSRVRIHEMTDDESLREHVRNIRAQLTKEESEAIIVDYIKNLPPGVFWEKVAEARRRNEDRRLGVKVA